MIKFKLLDSEPATIRHERNILYFDEAFRPDPIFDMPAEYLEFDIRKTDPKIIVLSLERILRGLK